MKKIVAFLKGKLEERKIENKVKRIEIALNSAELNFKSQKDDNEVKLDELMEKFNDPGFGVEEVIAEISEAIDCLDEAKEGLAKIERIRELLFEEVKK